MAKPHLVTHVIAPTGDGEEIKLCAYFDDEEIIVVELENKEIFRMDYENLVEWVELIKDQKV